MMLDGIGWYLSVLDGMHSGIRSCWAFPVTENGQDGIRVAILRKIRDNSGFGVGVLGGYLYCDFNERVAQKPGIIILLLFWMSNFSTSLRKKTQTVHFHDFRTWWTRP